MLPNIQVCPFLRHHGSDILNLTTKFIGYPAVLWRDQERGVEGDALCDLYKTLTITQAIIYCITRRKVDFLAGQLAKREFTILATSSPSRRVSPS